MLTSIRHTEPHSLNRNPLHLEAGLCLTGGLPNIERHFSEPVLEVAAKRYQGMGLQELLNLAAEPRIGLRASLGNLHETLVAAFSAIELPGILSNVANKFLLAGFDAVESAWREICAINRAPNFKPTRSYRMTGDVTYQPIGPGGEIKHGALGEEGFINQLHTYAKILSVTRYDIINDDLGALTTAARHLGRGAALKINDVFWRVFLDHADFFSDTQGNRLSGPDTALTVDGLTKASTAFLDQVDADGNPLGCDAKLLLVPNSLSVPANQLMASTEIRQNGGDDSYPIMNPHAGLYRVVRSSYLTKLASTQASDKAWYLLADPRDLPLIEFLTLRGNERPQIDGADANFDILGFQMRGVLDFGVALQDPRGGIKMAGE